MYLGGIVEQAPSDDLYSQPLHPYEGADVGRPVPDPRVEATRERILLQGDLPSRPPADAASTPAARSARRRAATPGARAPRDRAGHRVACHFAEDIAAGQITAHEVTPEEVFAG